MEIWSQKDKVRELTPLFDRPANSQQDPSTLLSNPQSNGQANGQANGQIPQSQGIGDLLTGGGFPSSSSTASSLPAANGGVGGISAGDISSSNAGLTLSSPGSGQQGNGLSGSTQIGQAQGQIPNQGQAGTGVQGNLGSLLSATSQGGANGAITQDGGIGVLVAGVRIPSDTSYNISTRF